MNIMPPLPQSEDSPHLQDWATVFKCKSCSAYDDSGNLTETIPVSTLLARIGKLHLARGTLDRLEKNIIFACFKARNAPHPDKDAAAEHRVRSRKQFDEMVRHHKDVARIRKYFADHLNMASKTMAHGIASTLPILSAGTDPTLDEICELQWLLEKYESGLIELSDFSHPAHQ